MQKIVFQRGSIVPPDYLNELQKLIRFTATPRSDYFSDNPSEDWEINTRDGLKDWEIDPQGSLGSVSHSGRILGVSGTNIVFGPASTTSYAPIYDVDNIFTGLDSDNVLASGSYGIIIESGSIVSATGEKQSWNRNFYEVVGGSSYYAIYHSSDAELQILETLPSRGEQFVLLASFSVDVNGALTYTDLRPSSQVDNLYTYTKTFYNTELISTDYTPNAWERVLLNAENGSLIITLRADAEDGDQILLIDALNKLSETHNLILRPEPEVLLQNSSSDWVISQTGSIIELYFLKELNSWRFKSNTDSTCEAIPGTFIQCGGELDGGITLPENCPDGEALPIDVRYGLSLGTFSYDAPNMKCTHIIDSKVAVYLNENGFNYEISSVRCGANNLSGTSPGAYGDENNIPVINVDETGKITGIGVTPITQTPLPVIDDLVSGTYGNKDSVAQVKITNKGLVTEIKEVPIFNTVTAGTYGKSTAVPRLNVDSKGRLVSISEQNIFSAVNSGTYGSTNTIPRVTVDSFGRITDITEQQVEIPLPIRAEDLYLYVNPITGDDNNDGLTAGSRVKTIQKAVIISSNYAYTADAKVVIYLSDNNTYPMRVIIPQRLRNKVRIVGNVSDPAGVILDGSLANTYFPDEETAGSSGYTLFCSGTCELAGLTLKSSGGTIPCGVDTGGSILLEYCKIDGGYAGLKMDPNSVVKIKDSLIIDGDFDTSVFINNGGNLEIGAEALAMPLTMNTASTSFDSLVSGLMGGATILQKVRFTVLTDFSAINFYDVSFGSILVLDSLTNSASSLITEFNGTSSSGGTTYIYY